MSWRQLKRTFTPLGWIAVFAVAAAILVGIAYGIEPPQELVQ